MARERRRSCAAERAPAADVGKRNASPEAAHRLPAAVSRDRPLLADEWARCGAAGDLRAPAVGLGGTTQARRARRDAPTRRGVARRRSVLHTQRRAAAAHPSRRRAGVRTGRAAAGRADRRFGRPLAAGALGIAARVRRGRLATVIISHEIEDLLYVCDAIARLHPPTIRSTRPTSRSSRRTSWRASSRPSNASGAQRHELSRVDGLTRLFAAALTTAAALGIAASVIGLFVLLRGEGLMGAGAAASGCCWSGRRAALGARRLEDTASAARGGAGGRLYFVLAKRRGSAVGYCRASTSPARVSRFLLIANRAGSEQVADAVHGHRRGSHDRARVDRLSDPACNGHRVRPAVASLASHRAGPRRCRARGLATASLDALFISLLPSRRCSAPIRLHHDGVGDALPSSGVVLPWVRGFRSPC